MKKTIEVNALKKSILDAIAEMNRGATDEINAGIANVVFSLFEVLAPQLVELDAVWVADLLYKCKAYSILEDEDNRLAAIDVKKAAQELAAYHPVKLIKAGAEVKAIKGVGDEKSI